MSSYRIEQALADARTALERLQADTPALVSANAACAMMAVCLKAGGKIMICGNGGSSCDANHFAEELTGRFRADRKPLAAMACTDVGHITCTANDYGFEHVFSRWVEALGRSGDVLIVLSTSGNSANILRAVDAAQAKGMQTISMLGKDGGKIKGRCTHEIICPGATSDRIQELHMLILHSWCEGLEKMMGLT